jgi:hypothetical protein
VTYIMVDWFPKRNNAVAGATVVPVVGPGYGGVVGQF